MRTILCFLAVLCGLSSCSLAQAEPRVREESALRAEAAAILAGLDLPAKAGQVLLIGVQGKGRAAPESLRTIEALGPGGILLYSFNIPDRPLALGPQIDAYQEAARRSAASQPLLVAVDHEGGRVFRFKSGITRLPAPLEAGLRGPAYVRLLGDRTGRELRALGINLVLAPVVETLNEENRETLGNRSYGSEPLRVDALARSFIAGLEAARVASVAKHFPGNAGTDPHEALPRLAADRAELEAAYYPRFRNAIDAGAPAIMLSHVLVPSVDAQRPASLSKALVDGELRRRLGFAGVVITDDLFMKALGAAPERSALLALNAGSDFLMLSAGSAAIRVRDAIVRAVQEGSLPAERLDEAVSRILMLKLRYRLAEGLEAATRAAALEAYPQIVEESARLLELPPLR